MIGKKNSTLRKKSVKESKLLATGVKAIKFWHEATLGETSIPFGSLVMPSDILLAGYSNPTSTELLSANLGIFHKNIEVFSSLNQKLMEGLSYKVNNNQINFIGGYTALEGEIFEVTYKNDVITGTNVVDARPLTSTGVLPIGQTDFNVGEAFQTNKYPNEQVGEVYVFADGVLQFRNEGNATATPSADGNYEEVHVSGGFGSIIRFNDVFATEKNILISSRGLISERPDVSMLQIIESVSGQLDSIIPTVAVLAGVPETNFQAVPNNIDLKAFNDRVVELENTSGTAIKYQYKYLQAGVTGIGLISDLTMNNLVIGKKYRVTLSVNWHYTTGVLNTKTGTCFGVCGGNLVVYDNIYRFAETYSETNSMDEVFIAAGTVLTISAANMANTVIQGTAGTSLQFTHIRLEELPNHEETTDFT